MGKVEPEYDYGSLCVGMHMHMYADRMTLILTVGTVNETYSWHEKDNYSSSSPHVYFLCVFFFPHSFAKSPHTQKKTHFVQATSMAFQKHNCFPLWALLFPGMLISCDDQTEAGIKVVRFKHFVVFISLP